MTYPDATTINFLLTIQREIINLLDEKEIMPRVQANNLLEIIKQCRRPNVQN